jgi:hypothetical protein
MAQIIEEGRAASKVKFGYFLSMPQPGVSADVIPNSDFWNIFPKNRRNKDISSSGILISWLPFKFRSFKILGPVSNF